jgi:hypothetical protein
MHAHIISAHIILLYYYHHNYGVMRGYMGGEDPGNWLEWGSGETALIVTPFAPDF